MRRRAVVAALVAAAAMGGGGPAPVDATLPGVAGAGEPGQGAVRLRSNAPLLFPMAERPRCDVLDNFGDPRSSGRTHQGSDLLATLGQPVYAVVDGTLTHQWVAGNSNATLSGSAWRLEEAEGTYYFYAHLSGFAPGLTVGSTVQRGQVIGYVGDTGNPGAGNYHLHFEVHPGGGAAVNPLPRMAMPLACRVF
jgi:murein DD-endopeptidase MepM/ murein hydrolase activator NlpD